MLLAGDRVGDGRGLADGRRLADPAAPQRGVHEGEQQRAGGEEGAAVQKGQPGAQSAALHGAAIRYPPSRTVSISGGSPSLARSRPIVVLTVWVKGLVASSQARSSSCSADTTAPS